MTTSHLELLVEDPSTEAFLHSLLPRLLPDDRSFQVHSFRGKPDLLGKISGRLKGYSQWLPADWRILVVIDRDRDDCKQLKVGIERIAKEAGLRIRTNATADEPWQIAIRIAIEELEAWYFGDWEGVCMAYPRVSPTLVRQEGFRVPDEIAGGTWEAFERVMQAHGYFPTGLPKTRVARELGKHIQPDRNSSRSFAHFREVVRESIG
jgi:hypothetical protein